MNFTKVRYYVHASTNGTLEINKIIHNHLVNQVTGSCAGRDL